MKDHWKIREYSNDKINEISNTFGIDKYLASIVLSRNLSSIKEIHDYLNPRFSNLHSPFLLKDMKKAVDRIKQSLENNEQIGIFTDSDLDGLTSLTIITKLLDKVGCSKKPFVRYPEGENDYGLTTEVIDYFSSIGVTLLITLDSGIRDIDEIGLAVEKGISVIVCDHHEPDEVLPEAIILNPKQDDCSYPFRDLAGVGVALKLCYALLYSSLKRYNQVVYIISVSEDGYRSSRIRNRIIENERVYQDKEILTGLEPDAKDIVLVYNEPSCIREFQKLWNTSNVFDFIEFIHSGLNGGRENPGNLESLCSTYSINTGENGHSFNRLNEIFLEFDFRMSPKLADFLETIVGYVAIGTIADIMPLVDENRIITFYGLQSMSRTKDPALRMLIDNSNKKIKSRDIIYQVSPLLNSPGRFGKPRLTADFFLEKDEKILRDLYKEIELLNSNRKSMVGRLHSEVMDEVSKQKVFLKGNLLFVTLKDIPDGLCGLLATRLSESVLKPAVVVSVAEDKDVFKGSGRTCGDFDFFSSVEPYSHLFERIGGHAQAFGFSARKENLDQISEGISNALKSYGKDSEKESMSIDAEIPVDKIEYGFIESISMFEPFGKLNPEILFVSRNIAVKSFQRFGNDRSHGKYLLRGNHGIEAIGWRMADEMESKLKKESIDAVYSLETNFFAGNRTARMIIHDID